MIDPAILLPYILASLLFALVPGPSVTILGANSPARGTRAGLLTVLGVQVAMLMMVLVVALGLEVVMSVVAEAFTVIKMVGAAYLIWIGFKMFTSSDKLDMSAPGERLPYGRYFWNGFVTNASNPKTLLFLGAFLPQFVDMSRPAFDQILVLGLIVMAVAATTDAIYAILAGSARQLLTQARVKMMNRVSGVILMLGGVWLALQKRG